MSEFHGCSVPVQISANVILILCKTSVVVSEAEACTDLEKKTQPFLLRADWKDIDFMSLLLEEGKPTGLSMYKTEYAVVQA